MGEMCSETSEDVVNDVEAESCGGDVKAVKFAPFKVLSNGQDDRDSSTTIVITSPLLISKLKEACINYPGTEYRNLFHTKVILAEPFMILFHNLSTIQDFAFTTDVFAPLLRFLMHREAWTVVHKLRAGSCRVLAFADLWLLYRPGTTVYQHPLKDGDGWLAFKIESAQYFHDSVEDQSELRIRYYSLVFDPSGDKLIPRLHTLAIRSYIGVRFVADLRLTPGEFMAKSLVKSLRSTLQQRGRKYWSFAGHAVYQEYFGDAWCIARKASGIRVSGLL